MVYQNRLRFFCAGTFNLQCPKNRLGDELFKQIFERILSYIIDLGIAHPKSISVDSTSVLADVKLPKDDNMDTKQPISPSDPDARYGRTSDKNKFFGYRVNLMVDNDSACILNIDAKPGNTEDYNIEEKFIKEPMNVNNIKPREAALDRGFDTYRIRNIFKEQKITAAIPVRATKYDNKLYGKEDFNIDLKNKEVTCPANEQLKYRGYCKSESSYIFTGTKCDTCGLKNKCTNAKIRKLNVHEDYLLKNQAVKFNKTKRYRTIFKKRTCVERIIAEAKRYHGMLRARFRCLWKLKIQAYLTAIAINLKRAARFFIERPSICTVALEAGP